MAKATDPSVQQDYIVTVDSPEGLVQFYCREAPGLQGGKPGEVIVQKPVAWRTARGAEWRGFSHPLVRSVRLGPPEGQSSERFSLDVFAVDPSKRWVDG